MGAHRTTPAASFVVIVIISSIVNALSDLLLVEKIFFAARRARWRFSADDAPLLVDVRLADNLIVVVCSNSFSDDDRLLANDDCLGRWRRSEEVRGATVSLNITVIIAARRMQAVDF